MYEHSSLQMMCELWITFDALDEALPACLAAPCRLLAHFPSALHGSICLGGSLPRHVWCREYLKMPTRLLRCGLLHE